MRIEEQQGLDKGTAAGRGEARERREAPDQGTIRIGHFEFLNGYPLYYGLEKGAGWGCFQLVNGVPTTLNRLLLAGELDISPVSSIEYASHADELLLFPRISITADGAVDSIRLVCRRPIDEVATVALTGQSATSVVLLKILLKQKYGLEPEYSALEGGVEAALERHDAVLLIGDQALEAFYREPAVETAAGSPGGADGPGGSAGAAGCSYDLGTEWKQLTGLPMVFALWAVRRPFFEARADETREVEDRLIYSIDYCRGHWDEVVEAASRIYPFDRELLSSYFLKLRYDFSSQYQRGLADFYRRAVEIGEARAEPRLQFIGE